MSAEPTAISPTPAMERELLAVARLARTYTVGVTGRTRSTHGSGVVWRHDGLIVTSAHVARESRFTLELYDGRSAEARLVSRDDECGLALLQTNARGLLIGPPGDPWGLHEGSLVMAVQASQENLAPMSLGLVRSMTLDDEDEPRWLVADISVPATAAGGPVVDTRARVVGISTVMGGGIGAAVPSNVIQRFVREAESAGLIPQRAQLAA